VTDSNTDERVAWGELARCTKSSTKPLGTGIARMRSVLKRISLLAAVALGAVSCSPQETQAAEDALATWRNQRPREYSYVLEPISWQRPVEPLRIKVQNEDVLEAIARDGSQAEPRDYSMTGLLREALAASDESTFSASYDSELGYVKSFFYASGPGGYGYEVRCFEPTLDESACNDVFRMAE
jgi:hypothetical protein